MTDFHVCNIMRCCSCGQDHLSLAVTPSLQAPADHPYETLCPITGQTLYVRLPSPRHAGGFLCVPPSLSVEASYALPQYAATTWEFWRFRVAKLVLQAPGDPTGTFTFYVLFLPWNLAIALRWKWLTVRLAKRSVG